MKRLTAFLLMLSLLAFGGTAAADSIPDDTFPHVRVYRGGVGIPDGIYPATPDCIFDICTGCPFKVCMGDPVKPSAGWSSAGWFSSVEYGSEEREYEGLFDFDELILDGTREGGVCAVKARHRFIHYNGVIDTRDPQTLDMKFRDYWRERLSRRYGEPGEYAEHAWGGVNNLWWDLSHEPSPIDSINLSVFFIIHRDFPSSPLWYRPLFIILTYLFDNHTKCEPRLTARKDSYPWPPKFLREPFERERKPKRKLP